MPIYRLLQEGAFDQADIERMAAAYEAAIGLLRLNDRDDPLCELVAKKIIEHVRNGERDGTRLTARAIAEIGVQPPEAAAPAGDPQR